MPTGNKHSRRLRVWPAIVWPLGATLLFLGGGALFINKIAADQQKADTAALRLESYARLEAGELATRARALGNTFIETRLNRRAEQEKNRRLLLRSVMDGVQRVLGAGLEKSRAAAAPRDVGDFPVGFDGLRVFLELAEAPSARTGDAALTALRACAPELAALLPSGCSLTVVENNFEELLALGGGPTPENARVESISREFIWGEGTESRHWTLQVSLAEPDEFPFPDASELAAHLNDKLATVTLDSTAWRGWLVDRSGKPVAAFPAADAGRPGYVETAEEWIDVENRRLVWLNRTERLEQVGLAPAVAVSIDRPAPPLVPAKVFAGDLRWSSFLSAFALLSLGLWIWFARAMMVGRAAVSARAAVSEKLEKPVEKIVPRAVPAAARAAERRLVRKEPSERGVSIASGMIVADIDDAGEVHVEAVRPSFPEAGKRDEVPSGSLLRLQERHRGGEGKLGSRALDRAGSRLIRQLAERVRPVVGGSELAGSRSAGRGASRVDSTKATQRL